MWIRFTHTHTHTQHNTQHTYTIPHVEEEEKMWYLGRAPPLAQLQQRRVQLRPIVSLGICTLCGGSKQLACPSSPLVLALGRPSLFSSSPSPRPLPTVSSLPQDPDFILEATPFSATRSSSSLARHEAFCLVVALLLACLNPGLDGFLNQLGATHQCMLLVISCFSLTIASCTRLQHPFIVSPCHPILGTLL